MMLRTMAACTLLPPLPLLAGPVWVGRFLPDAGGAMPAPWRVEQLDAKVPPTRYRLREWDGVHAVEAHAVKSMALLARPLQVDLGNTPVLCWRWRIDAPLKSADMTRKSGDDYAARVYLSFEVPAETLSFGTRMGLSLARTLRGDQVPDAAINYIWDNRHPLGTWQPNAYTDRARMLAACRSFRVSATGVHCVQGKARRRRQWLFHGKPPQRRHARNAPPSRRVAHQSGVCGVAALARRMTAGGAPRLASIRFGRQRISRGKSDRLLVLRTGGAEAGRWVDERRDVAADFQRAFGHAPARLTGLAIASDTDNTGEEARAGFADFRFVERDATCPPA